MKQDSETYTPLSGALRTLDRLVLSYIALVGLLFLAFGEGMSRWALPLVHLVLFLVILLIIRQWGSATTGWRGFLRLLYAPLLFTFFYEEIGGAIHFAFPHFFDAELIAFEKAILGFHPTVAIQRFQVPLLNEWMMLGYLSYYFLLPMTALPLFFRRKPDELVRLLFACSIAFFISYLGFIVYPVEGPRYFLAAEYGAPLAGWFFVPIVKAIIGMAALHGGCMPSSHCAVALVILVHTRRSLPKLSAALAPLVVTLWMGTVWGRFHYATDVVVGLAVGGLALWIADRKLGIVASSSRVRVPGTQVSTEAVAAEPVSVGRSADTGV